VAFVHVLVKVNGVERVARVLPLATPATRVLLPRSRDRPLSLPPISKITRLPVFTVERNQTETVRCVIEVCRKLPVLLGVIDWVVPLSEMDALPSALLVLS